jgi:NAD(P)-dependent dehydrogenase (short-subunit alcohol dehydrogenase family)
MGKLHGKMAVITGGTTGIGLASANLFVKARTVRRRRPGAGLIDGHPKRDEMFLDF